MPFLCPNCRSLYFGLKPTNCLRRDSFGCKLMPKCNFPAGGSDALLPLPTSDKYRFLSKVIARYYEFYRKRSKRPAAFVSGNWSSSSIYPMWLYLCQHLQTKPAAVIWTFTTFLVSLWWWGFQIGIVSSNWGRDQYIVCSNVDLIHWSQFQPKSSFVVGSQCFTGFSSTYVCWLQSRSFVTVNPKYFAK